MKYAIVMTATADFIPGVNATLNALRYYGHDPDIQVHLLTWHTKRMDAWLDTLAERNPWPNFRVIDMAGLQQAGYSRAEEVKPGSYWPMVFWRWEYAASLTGYDAVMIMDADCVLLNNISPWFHMAASSGKLILCNNDRSALEPEDATAAHLVQRRESRGTALHSHPTFFRPAEIKDLARDMVTHAKIGSDMVALNQALAHLGMMDKALVLPCVLWL